MQQRLYSLLQNVASAFDTTAAQIRDPLSYPEQISDPHPMLTDTCTVIRVAKRTYAPAEQPHDDINNYLEYIAPFFGYYVTGSYTYEAVILERIPGPYHEIPSLQPGARSLF